MSSTAVSPYNQFTNTILGPLQVSTCSLWLDGQDTSSIVFNGNNVTTWKDKSGSGNDAIATGNISNTPSINGYNAMTYPGVTNTFFRGSMINTTTASVTGFAVVTILPASFSNIRIISLGISTTVDYNDTLYTSLIQKGGSGMTSYRANGYKSTASYTDGTVGIACSIYDGLSNYFYVNGTAGIPVDSTGIFGYSNYEIGSGFGEDTLPMVQYSGSIGEIILFNNIALNNQQRQQVEGYLAWKWGLQTSLPITHPYYNNAYLSNSIPISYFPPRLTQTSIIPIVPGFTIPITITQYVFNPRSISNLVLWLDAADANTIIQSGSTVTQWNDKSGNNNNTTARSGNSLLIQNAINRQPAISLTNTYFTGTFAVANTGFQVHCFAVATMNSSSTAYGRILSLGRPGVDDFNNTTTTFPFIRDNNTSTIMIGRNSRFLPVPTPGYSTPFLVQSSHLSNIESIGVNGTLTPSSFDTFAATAFNITSYGVGTNTNTTDGAGLLNGYIGEIIVYTNFLNTNQRQQIEGYLAWKWGLQSNLPTSHTYSLFPP